MGEGEQDRRPMSACVMEEKKCFIANKLVLSVIVLGASGDLAKKKTFPALFTLFRKGFLPKNLKLIGYARSKLSNSDLHEKIKGYLKGDDKTKQEFLDRITYVQGQYDGDEGFQGLEKALQEREKDFQGAPLGRLFYLALPPSVYPQVCAGIKKNCTHMNSTGKGSWLRLVIEKPFGMDLKSSEDLANKLGELFPEEQLYRIDHYLGKELMQNMLVLRFANQFLSPTWHRNFISNVQICFKEPFGTEGRGGYFDEFGIIRDVMQNHLTQILALLAMEQPVTLSADDIRDEKVRLLRALSPVALDDTVLGQYTAAGDQPGYLDDETVPKGSKTPTFATCVMRIHNERWAGVPWIMKAGKALNERKVEIRVQYKPPAASIHGDVINEMRNELVLRLQPDEAIYMKIVVKKPGLEMESIVSELDLSYKQRYGDTYIPDAYERLILDAIRGDQQHFVRRDELRAAWAAFTPLLHAIDNGEAEPMQYPAGSRGPPASDILVAKAGFVKNANYIWKREDVPGDIS
ncbi:Glucose-6-phosphate 1-dehydrogenase, cytoplasmic isoform [Coccomyxa viridis]|uniref:Glucose-6-phosphate 1-dehydrogenase n=1 Tax=Coccomyxa viridis TaxID=1274662 RepID=A0AAV1IH91_9CHLO|nr:Glucose-6-phosphate 1-dehydrogenase, cytoplasmic isoform [Coccomyxa viridis]